MEGVSETEREGHRDGMSTTGSRKLDLKQYNEINTQLAKYDWNLDLTVVERTAWGNESLADPRPVPGKVTENLAKVQKACDKAIADGKAIMRRFEDLINPFSDTDNALLGSLRTTIEPPPIG